MGNQLGMKHCTTCGKQQKELAEGLVYVEKDKPYKSRAFCSQCASRQRRMGLVFFTAVWNPAAMPEAKVESIIEADVKNSYRLMHGRKR